MIFIKDLTSQAGIIWKEHGALKYIECSQSLANHWELELKSHASAGHDLTLDDGAWVCEKIMDWLEQPDLHTPTSV